MMVLTDAKVTGGQLAVGENGAVIGCDLYDCAVAIDKQGMLSGTWLVNCKLLVEEGALFGGNHIYGGTHSGFRGDGNHFEQVVPA